MRENDVACPYYSTSSCCCCCCPGPGPFPCFLAFSKILTAFAISSLDIKITKTIIKFH